jgi:ABC-type branched-subunit amino acid transport system permease subunit
LADHGSLWIGLLLVAVVMFLPNGILGGLARFLPRKT